MPSKAFGFGNRKGAIQRPNTSNTSPASIKLQKRRAAALELRERGRSYRSIAQELKCSPQTVLNYVVAAIRQTIPKESAQQVLVLEMRRFDSLLAKFYPKALRGDKAAAELCLKIGHMRSKLCGLYPQPNTPLIFNANLNAESDFGWELKFVKPGDRMRGLIAEHDRREAAKVIEHLPMPTETKQ
jgi:DNA-binding CsgD family transcriptional regulator